MNKMALAILKSQIVPLIEKFEPELQGILTKTIQSLKESKPEEAKLFYTNWKLLNAAIEKEFNEPAPAPLMKGGEESTGPIGIAPVLPEASPPIIEPTGPTGPIVSEASGPSFIQETGPTGPSIVERITGFFSPETGPMAAGDRKLFAPNGGSYKAGRRKRGKTAKQHKKRTHRVKHRKH